MRPADARVIGALGLAAIWTALTASCSAPLHPQADTGTAARAKSVTAAARIAQLEFGSRAAYETCVPPACPAVTPKTLAVDAPTVAQAPRPVEPSTSLDVGEKLVVAEPQRSIPPAAQTAATATSRAEPSTKQLTVHFAFASAVLSPAARDQIDEAVRGLTAVRRIAISGRTDSVGPLQVNQALALARAQAVQSHLRWHHPHLAPAVTLDAEGACCFIAANDTAQGRALNRRVEIVFERDSQDL